MKKLILIAILSFGMIFPLVAVDIAVITSVSGKVEIQAPGKGWVAATPGTQIFNGTTISTGFNSGATLDLGSSEILIRQLTRMELGELIQQQDTIKTDLTLKVGRIKAEIKQVEGLKHDFTMRSSVSTASVRGTTVDNEEGEKLSSEDGTFVATNQLGQEVTVSRDESVEVETSDEGGEITTAEEVFDNESEVVTNTSSNPDPPPEPVKDPNPEPAPEPEPTTTTVTITWN